MRQYCIFSFPRHSIMSQNTSSFVNRFSVSKTLIETFSFPNSGETHRAELGPVTKSQLVLEVTSTIRGPTIHYSQEGTDPDWVRWSGVESVPTRSHNFSDTRSTHYHRLTEGRVSPFKGRNEACGGKIRTGPLW